MTSFVSKGTNLSRREVLSGLFHDIIFELCSDGESHRLFLSDQDKIFQELKYLHMSVVLERLNQFTEQLEKYNPQKKLQKDAGAGADGREGAEKPVGDGKSSGTEIKNMINIIQNLNQYSELKEKHLNNLLVAQKVMEVIEKNKLINAADIEEIMMNANVDRDAKTVKKSEVLQRVKEVIRDEAIQVTDKMRIVAIFLMTQPGITEESRR